MGNFKIYVSDFFGFYGTIKYGKKLISVYDGTVLSRKTYDYKAELEDIFICIFGIFNKKNNIGKLISRKESIRYISICAGLHGFFKSFSWNNSQEAIQRRNLMF